MKKLLTILFCLMVGTANAAVELDSDSSGGVDINLGGTNATTAANARTNLGLAIGTDVQAYDANLPTWPATVDATEVGYLNGVTSALQTQLDAKEGTLTNEAGLYSVLSDVALFYEPGDTLQTNSSTTLPGTCTTGELFLDTDADTNGELYLCVATNTWKASDDDGGAGGMSDIVEDTSPQLGGNLDIQAYNIEGVDATEFGYVDGVTSDVQTQLDAKEGDLSNEAGLYAALSDVTLFLEDVVDDTTPTLGGNLNAGGYDITNIGGLSVSASATPSATFEDSDGAGADDYAASIEVNMTTTTDGAEVSDYTVYYQDAGSKTAAFVVDGSDNQLEIGINTTLQSGDIVLAEMAANSVDSDQYVDGSIDAVHLSADAKFQALAVADLNDSTTPSVLTTAETTNKLISNYKSSGADHVFTLPTAHAAANVIFVVGDEFQVDIEPPSGTALYLNGTAAASDEHIVNTADTLAETIVCVCASINGTLTWLCDSKYSNFGEATP